MRNTDQNRPRFLRAHRFAQKRQVVADRNPFDSRNDFDEHAPLSFGWRLGFFVLGLGVFVNIRIVGYVTVTELLTVGLMPILAASGWFKDLGKDVKMLLVCNGHKDRIAIGV